VRCRGCKAEIAVVVELVGVDGKQTKTLSRTFHTLTECSHCHERHLYDYSDMMTGQKPELVLPV
jgi:cytochrome c553